MLIKMEELCSVYLYKRGEYERDTLYQLWKILEEDEDSEHLMWGYPSAAGRQYETRGDITDFIHHFNSSGRIVFLIYSNETHECAGYIWFDEIIYGHKANGSIYIRKEYRGKLTQEASKICMEFMIEAYHLEAIWALTPWESAYKLGIKLGFKDVAVLQDYITFKNKRFNLFISKLEVGK